VLGVAAGHLLLNVLANDFNLISRLGQLPITSPASILFSLLAILLGGGACLLGAVVPIFRLARMEPLSALKEE
jgi:ABC-type antimicrobial peptide transport system permease subunit